MDWSTATVAAPDTVKVAVPTLLFESIAVIVTLPDRPTGIVAYAMNAPLPLALMLAGEVTTTVAPI